MREAPPRLHQRPDHPGNRGRRIALRPRDGDCVVNAIVRWLLPVNRPTKYIPHSDQYDDAVRPFCNARSCRDDRTPKAPVTRDSIYALLCAIRLDVDLADDLPPVLMNAGKIEQVLINLLINAGHAADKDESWVKVTARPAVDREGWVEVRVADNGAGIGADKLDKIFEPFFTSKGRDQGTGLGLSISHRIVEEHEGTLTVDSEPGEGACFTVLLPPAPAE